MWPFEPYKIDTEFNKPASYGPHEGLDLNVAGTWGNQDLGTPIKCIYPGRVIHSSASELNYGNLLVIESNTPQGKRWARYCHLQSHSDGFMMRGDIIGTMGSTGNSTASHLHLDVLKKKPSHWRFYSKNILEWYVDPRELINAIIETPMEQDKLNALKNLEAYRPNRTQGQEGSFEGFVNAIIGSDRSITSIENELTQAKERIKTLEATPPATSPVTPIPVEFTDPVAKNYYHQALQAEAWSKL